MAYPKSKIIEEIAKATEGCQILTAEEELVVIAVISCLDDDYKVDKVLLKKKLELESDKAAEEMIASIVATCQEKMEKLLAGEYPKKMGEEGEGKWGR